MAIHEQDREDLLREGRAMPLRGETTIANTTVVVGFRSGGQMSLYCGADPVFQFNAENELRRAYYQADRYAAQNGKLVLLARSTKGGRVQFEPQAIEDHRQQDILADLQRWLTAIDHRLANDRDGWKVADSNHDLFFAQLRTALQGPSNPPKIANQPNQ